MTCTAWRIRPDPFYSCELSDPHWQHHTSQQISSTLAFRRVFIEMFLIKGEKSSEGSDSANVPTFQPCITGTLQVRRSGGCRRGRSAGLRTAAHHAVIIIIIDMWGVVRAGAGGSQGAADSGVHACVFVCVRVSGVVAVA